MKSIITSERNKHVIKEENDDHSEDEQDSFFVANNDLKIAENEQIA